MLCWSSFYRFPEILLISKCRNHKDLHRRRHLITASWNKNYSIHCTIFNIFRFKCFFQFIDMIQFFRKSWFWWNIGAAFESSLINWLKHNMINVFQSSHNDWQTEGKKRQSKQTISVSWSRRCVLRFTVFHSMFVLALIKLNCLNLCGSNENNSSFNPFALVSKTQTYSKLKVRTVTGQQIPTSFTA